MVRPPLALAAVLLAMPAFALPVQVVDSAGKPVRDATVRSLAAADAAAARSDADGRVEAPEGAIRVEAGGFLPWEGEATGTIVLVRESRVLVRAVRRDTGAAVGAGRVQLWPQPEEQIEGGVGQLVPDGPPLKEQPLVEGRATLDGLAAGSYSLHVEADGFVAFSRAVALGPEAQDELDLRLSPASVVEGRVLRAGRPVPDAKLRVHPGMPREFARMAGRGARGGGGPGGGMMRALEALTATEIASDSAGRFRFDQLPANRPLPFVLIAQAPDFSWGYALVPQTARGASTATAADRTVPLDVTLLPGSDLSGRVRWSDGEPAAGVRVVAEIEQERRGWGGTRRYGIDVTPVFEEWGGGPETVTGPEGEFTILGLPPATWRVLATPFEHAPSDPVVVDLAEGAARPELIEVEIARGLGVEGVVVDASGNPVPHAEIVGELTRSGARWPEQQLDTEADGKGRFSLSGFDPGELVLRVSASGFGTKRIEIGPVAEAGSQRIVLDRTGGLFGLVLNAASGDPLTRFRVSAVRAEDEPDSGRNRFAGRRAGPEIVSESGEFELEEIKEGRWAVLVRAEGFLARVSETVEVRAGELSDVGSIELMPGAVLTGRVEDVDTREGIEGATVTVEGLGGRSGRFRFQRRGWGANGQAPTDTTSTDGSFRLDGLPPGEFTVSAAHHAYPVLVANSARISVGDDPLQPIPSLVIELERGGSVSGRVLDAGGEAQPGAMVVAAEPDARGRGGVVGGPVEADAEGSFVIEALPAGQVMVRRADRMDEGVKVNVRKGEVSEVVLQDGGVRVFGGVYVEGRPVEGRVRLLAGRWGAPRTDWGTSYELLGVPPGEWQLRVDIRDPSDPTAPLREERVSLLVPEDLTELKHDIQLEAEDVADDAVLTGRILDIDTGEGLDAWLVTARKQGSGPETARSDEFGNFSIVLKEDGEWTIAAMATRNDPPYDMPDPVQVRTEAGQLLDEPPTFRAKRRLEVIVNVTDVAGAPVPGASCALVNKREHLSPQSGLRTIGPRGMTTDEFGRATVSASEPGLQDLLIMLPSRAFVIRTGVDVGGIGELDVQLPRTGTLEIRGARQADLLDLPGGWWIKLHSRQSGAGLVEAHGDTLRVHGLPSGDYRVRVGGQIESVEVVPGTTPSIVDFSS